MGLYGQVLVVDQYRSGDISPGDAFSQIYCGLDRDLSYCPEQYRSEIEQLLRLEYALISFLCDHTLISDIVSELAKRAGFAGSTTVPIIAPAGNLLDTLTPILKGSGLNICRGPTPLGKFYVQEHEEVLRVKILTCPGTLEYYGFRVPLAC